MGTYVGGNIGFVHFGIKRRPSLSKPAGHKPAGRQGKKQAGAQPQEDGDTSAKVAAGTRLVNHTCPCRGLIREGEGKALTTDLSEMSRL